MFVIKYVPSGDYVTSATSITSDIAEAKRFADRLEASQFLNDNGFDMQDPNFGDLYEIEPATETEVQ